MRDIITFKVNRDPIPHRGGTMKPLPRGVAFVEDGFYVCLFAHSSGLWGITPGYAVVEKTSDGGDVQAWASAVFAASEIRSMQNPPGRCFRRLWRPGLDGIENVKVSLAPSDSVLNQAGMALALLLRKLDDLAGFVEFDSRNLQTFSHRTRELLILSCTEVEASLRAELKAWDPNLGTRDRLNTNAYYRVCDPLHLREYRAELRHFSSVPAFEPFVNWDLARPTTSLPWYHAYNAVKHDRETALHRATLQHCLEATAAAAIIFCAQLSIPITGDFHEPAFEVNRWFSIRLVDPDPSSFYVPPVRVQDRQIPGLLLFDGRGTAAWVPEDLRI
jgi:hypothetical protein